MKRYDRIGLDLNPYGIKDRAEYVVYSQMSYTEPIQYLGQDFIVTDNIRKAKRFDTYSRAISYKNQFVNLTVRNMIRDGLISSMADYDRIWRIRRV